MGSNALKNNFDLIPEISGLSILEEIGRGAQGAVFKALRKERLVAVKVFFEKSEQFKKEATALGRIRHVTVPEVIEVGETENLTYFVMEYVPSLPLSEVLKKGPLPENEVHRLACALADGLQVVHHRGLVHSDLKPGNILIAEGTKAPKMIDFGFARRNQKLGNGDEFVGTFDYSSPEQMRTLRREIDGRSDLYSLGLILFEALTGQRPFRDQAGFEVDTNSTSRVPYAHEISQNVTKTFSKIIAKLLANDPDDRYQSAKSLLWDLENPIRLQDVGLGHKYNSMNVTSDLPLIGRKRELQSLTAAMDKSLYQQQLMVAVIEGQPGAGKSRLIRELNERVLENEFQIFFAKAQLSESTPLALIRRLIENYLREVRELPSAQRSQKENDFRQAAGEYAPVLKNFTPSLAVIFNDSPVLNATTLSQDQYYEALAFLLSQVANLSKASAFFIDDIQWLDEGSRQIFKRIYSKLRNKKCFFVTTARDDHSSVEGLNEFIKLSEPAQTLKIKLEFLSLEESAELIRYQLGQKFLEAELYQKVFELSQGSPFALVEYIQAMFEAGCFSPFEGSWKVDFTKLEQLDLPKDVIQLVLKRIDRLPADARKLLYTAALCGSTINLKLVSAVNEVEEKASAEALSEALQMNLLEKDATRGYRFTHDRIREAFLELYKDEKAKRNAYDKIASEYLKIVCDSVTAEDVYSLARFYRQSNWGQQTSNAFITNLKAGIFALKDFANHEAKAFLTFAFEVSVLSKEISQANKIHLEEALAEVYFRLAQLEESYKHYENLLGYLHDPLKRATVRCRMSMVRLTTQKVLPASEELHRAFKELEIRLPKTILGKFVLGFYYGFLALFCYVSRIGFATSKNRKREYHRTLAELTSYSTQIYYYHNDIPGIFYVAMRSLFHVHRIGVSPEFVSSYIFMACLTGVLKLRKLLDFFSNGALKAAETLNHPLLIAQVHMMRAISVNFTGEIVEAEVLSKKALLGFESWIPPLEWLIGAGDYITGLLYRGYFEEAIAWGDKAFKRVENNKEQATLVQTHGGYPVLAISYAVRGDFYRAAEIFNDFRGRIQKTPSEPYLWNSYLSCYILFLLEQNELGPELDAAIEKHESFELNPLTCLFHFRQIFVAVAYARLAQYENAPDEMRVLRFKQLKKSYLDLFWSANVPMYKGHRFIIQAALARYSGKTKRAEKYLNSAEQIALSADSPWMKFEILKQRADFLRDQKLVAQAKLQATMAYHLASEFQWEAKRKTLQRQFSFLAHLKNGAITQAKSRVAMTTNQSLQSVRDRKQRMALMQLGLALTKTFDPEEQVRIALTEIVKLLNGERAFLFLTQENQKLSLKLGLNNKGESLPELAGFSRSIVEKVLKSQQPVVLAADDEKEFSLSESISAQKLRSIIAVPLMRHEQLIGVVYLDSQLARGLFSEDDIDILTVLANHIGVSLEAARAAQVMLLQKSLESDLHLAGVAQSFLLPKCDLFEEDVISGVAYYKSASQTSGDWWNYSSDNSGYHFVVADVTGHGAGAAMVSAAAIGVYQTLMSSAHQLSIKEKLERMNAQFCKLVQSQYSMTLFALEISKDGKTLKAWSAGSPPVFLMDSKGQIEYIMKASTPLGYEDFELEEFQSSLNPGDRIFIFTDGFLEFTPIDGSSWGERKLKKLLQSTLGMPVKESREKIANAVAAYQGNNPPDDDMTLLIIDIKAPNK